MIGIVFNDSNIELMDNELESLEFQRLDDEIEMVYIGSNYSQDILITDIPEIPCLYDSIKFILIINDIRKEIFLDDNVILIQYESEYIKNISEKFNPLLKEKKSVVINRLPVQKFKIHPLESQDATIFYHGIDAIDNRIDEMFGLDREVYYEIKYYGINTKEEPSKMHRLSWNVNTNKNNIGFISSKIINELENGCLPILLKEHAPYYLKDYPFLVSKEQLNNKEQLIIRIKEISHLISKMTREEFSSLANSIYNSIYIHSKWKYNFYLIAEEINIHIKKNRV